LFEYILLAASSLFVIVDPPAVVPAFLAITPNDTAEQRIRTARLAVALAVQDVRAQRGGIELGATGGRPSSLMDVAISPAAL
jgi:hypothetical protein